MTTQALIVCADDFALDSGVSTAIVQLAEQGHISATSAMSLSPNWPEHARWLKPLSPHIDVGLHLDWTSPFAITAGHGCSLPQLMQRTLTRSLNRQQARTVIDTQLDRFEAAWGAAPAHVDGHQHIHQFPIIREALVQSLTVRYPRGQRPWLRVSRPLAPGLDIKSRVIQGMGAAALQQQAQQAGLPHSSWLTGIYGFSGTAADYEAPRRGADVPPWARHQQHRRCHPRGSKYRVRVFSRRRVHGPAGTSPVASGARSSRFAGGLSALSGFENPEPTEHKGRTGRQDQSRQQRQP